MANRFYESMESFERTAAAALTKSAKKEVPLWEKGHGTMPVPFMDELSFQMEREKNIVARYNQDFQNYLAIIEQSAGYDYLFVSERSAESCDACARHHGTLFTKNEVAQNDVIPPLHPNCRCSLVALDSNTLLYYNGPNGTPVLEQLQRALDKRGGGIFILDPQMWGAGFGEKDLRRVNPTDEPLIAWSGLQRSNLYQQVPGLIEELQALFLAELAQTEEDAAASALKFLASAATLAESFAAHLNTRFEEAWSHWEENPLYAILLASDAATGTLVSSIAGQFMQCTEDLVDDFSALSLANWLTLGLADAVIGAFNPEEFGSPEHVADILAVALFLAPFISLRGKAGGGAVTLDDAARLTADSLSKPGDDMLRAGLKPQELLDELVRSGEKHTLSDVVAITKTPDGKLVWLETGTESAGLKHIVTRHTNHFASKGVAESQIPELIIEALENGKFVSQAGKSGKVFDVVFYGQTQRVCVIVSGNGFVVTAYPY